MAAATGIFRSCDLWVYVDQARQFLGKALAGRSEMDRGYELFFEMLNTTFNAAELAGVRVQGAFPALVDFVVALSIAMSGEEGLNPYTPPDTPPGTHS
jgi:hypothetical protein